MTYGTPTWIWSVVVDDDSYVCAYHGKTVTDSTSRSAMDAGPERAVELLDKSARLELARLTELESVCMPLGVGSDEDAPHRYLCGEDIRPLRTPPAPVRSKHRRTVRFR
jgi:hypothetical protein